MTFSPDGQLLATCSNTPDLQREILGTISLWSVRSAQLIRTFSAHRDSVWHVEFSPDGERLVSSSADRTAAVWEVKTGRELVRLRGHGENVYQARFSPAGRRIATASDDKTVRIWDAATGKELLPLRGGHNSSTQALAYSRDGRRIASRDQRGIIKIWDADSGEELLPLRGPYGEGYSVLFGPEDRWLASTSSEDKTLCIWEATPPTPELRLSREAAAVVNALPAELGSRADMLDYLRTLPTLAEPLRAEALRLAERLPEDAERLTRAGYAVVQKTGLDAEKYRHALRQAETARDLLYPGKFAPPHLATRVIGIAHFRLGEYREAVQILTAYTRTADGKFILWGANPLDLAYLARAHQRLGDDATARAVVGQLFIVMQDAKWASSPGRIQEEARLAVEECVWGGPPPTEEERQLRDKAATLVKKPPPGLGFKDEILAELRSRPALDEAVREHAVILVERLSEEPRRLNRASSNIVWKAGLDADRYRLALRQAEAARNLAPPRSDFSPSYPPATQIGLAHYRLGEYREAVEALTASTASIGSLNPSLKAGTPWDMPYLAMARHHLGEHEEARALLARLREIMKAPSFASRADYLSYLREAEKLIEGHTQKPKP